jgi:hypothetical protein
VEILIPPPLIPRRWSTTRLTDQPFPADQRIAPSLFVSLLDININLTFPPFIIFPVLRVRKLGKVKLIFLKTAKNTA